MPLSPYNIVTITAGMMAMSRVMSRRNHGRRRMLKPSIDLPCQRAGERGILAGRQQCDREYHSPRRLPSVGEQFCKHPEFPPRPSAHSCGMPPPPDDENRRVYEQREHWARPWSQSSRTDRLAFTSGGFAFMLARASARWTNTGRLCGITDLRQDADGDVGIAGFLMTSSFGMNRRAPRLTRVGL